jgi:hypothetical protein
MHHPDAARRNDVVVLDYARPPLTAENPRPRLLRSRRATRAHGDRGRPRRPARGRLTTIGELTPSRIAANRPAAWRALAEIPMIPIIDSVADTAGAPRRPPCPRARHRPAHLRADARSALIPGKVRDRLPVFAFGTSRR